MNSINLIKVEYVEVDNEGFVKLTVNEVPLMLTIEEAFNLSERLHHAANEESYREHIDQVFDNWGKSGGESW